MLHTYITRECSCQMAFLYFTSLYVYNIHETRVQQSDGTSTSQTCVYFKMTWCVSATVRWHFYFTSLYGSIRHNAWVQLSDGTPTAQVCMFQTHMRRECTCQMAVLIHKRLRFKQAWGGAQLLNCTSTSQVCMNQTYITIACSRHEVLLLHKTICFKMTFRVSAAVRWHF